MNFLSQGPSIIKSPDTSLSALSAFQGNPIVEALRSFAFPESQFPSKLRDTLVMGVRPQPKFYQSRKKEKNHGKKLPGNLFLKTKVPCRKVEFF